eukprot:g3120.t1
MEKTRVVEAAREDQQLADPDGLFSCLPESERSRLVNALTRFFVLRNGLSPSVPAPRDEVVRIFNETRKKGNLPATNKLFPYFLATVKERLAEVYGIELRESVKSKMKGSSKRVKNEKETIVFHLRSLLQPSIRSQLLTPHELELEAILVTLINLVAINDGSLTKAELFECLLELGFTSGIQHEVFGTWEQSVLEVALKRRYLITSREDQETFGLGEAAFDEFPNNVLTKHFQQFQCRARSLGVYLADVDAEYAKTLANRANWYEAKWCAIDQPEWNPATFLSSTQITPELKLISIEVEISRERIALLNAYKRIGQKASIRIVNGMEYEVTTASAPFPEALNRHPLFLVRGDQSAYEVKTAVEASSVKTQLDVLVTKESAPDLFTIEEDTVLEVGPFKGGGINLRQSALGIYRYPTVVIFAEGLGIGTARALIEATHDIPNLSLQFREDARLYYKAPNEDSFIFKDLFEEWEKKGCKVLTTTESFQDVFDGDDTLVYEPTQTIALILTGGDEESEKAAMEVCKEAEITELVRESSDQPETVFLRTGDQQLALRLRDCLSRPYGDKTPHHSSSTTCYRLTERAETSQSTRSKQQNTEARSRSNRRLAPVRKSDEEGGVSTHSDRDENGSNRSSIEDAKSKLSLLLEDLTSRNESILEEAAKNCYELSISNADVRPLFLEMGLTKNLLEIARTTSQRKSRIFASLTLACLTSHERCREHLVKKGILQICLEQLEGMVLSEEVIGAWLRVIGRLAKFTEAAIIIVELHGLQTIVKVLLKGTESLKRRALIALYFIGADKPKVQEAFVAAGVITPLLALCSSSNTAVQLEAIDVCKVLSRCRSCADVFVANSGIRKFVQAASEGPTIDIKNSAYRVLQRLSSHGPEVSQLIIHEGTDIAGCDLSEDGVGKLIDVFSTGVISLQEEAAKIVEELCETDPVASNELSQPSIVKSLIILLSSASPDGVAYAVNSLSHMLSDEEVQSKVRKEEGAIQALLTTLHHGCERAADGAAVCLAKLCYHRKVAEEFVSQNCISKFLKALDERGDRVQLPISRILFYLKAVKACFLQNLVSCGGARVLVNRCWRGVPQVKVLCASLLADLCLDEAHLEQFRHGIQELRNPCGNALSILEANSKTSDKVLNERRIQAELTTTLGKLEDDLSINFSSSIEEAVRMVPRHFFAPSNKEHAALSGRRITFENSELELPSLDVHLKVLEALQLQQGQTFLELGCGTGYLLTLAKYLIGNSDIVGVDGDRLATEFIREALLKLNQERKHNEILPIVQRKPIPDFFSTRQRFDRIVVSVSFPKTLLGALRLLLRSNGKMVVPVEGKLLLMDKESGLHGVRVLCDYHPLKLLKQTYQSTREPGGVVIVDPERSRILCSSESRHSRLNSRIPRPESSAASTNSRQQGRSRIPPPTTALSRHPRVQRDGSGRLAPREAVRRHGTEQRIQGDENGHSPRESLHRTRRHNITEESASLDCLTEELRKEFAPYAVSSQDIRICLLPNGKRFLLGEGGFGAVYKALMNNVDEVAVKVVRRRNPSTQDLQSFLQEIRVLSSLRHRNIVQFYGACLRSSGTFFVTEMMKGGDLYTVIRNHKDTMRWDRFGKKVALDVALGLNYLHSRKPPMMHRDLKSPNVLLSEEGNAKIADVGMVRTQDRDLVTAQRIMTPLWAAPEVMRKQRTNIKADVWSYGILIWEISTGEDIIEFEPLAYSYVGRPATRAANNRQMVMPDNVPEVARRIFAECTRLDPGGRPAMKDIVKLLRRG